MGELLQNSSQTLSEPGVKTPRCTTYSAQYLDIDKSEQDLGYSEYNVQQSLEVEPAKPYRSPEDQCEREEHLATEVFDMLSLQLTLSKWHLRRTPLPQELLQLFCVQYLQ